MGPLGVPLLLSGVGAIDPATLFVGGQLGVWYDPSDLSSMFQEEAGTTPAAVDSPVGKLNDKSGNGYHLTQGTSSARPVLRSSGGLYWLEFDGVDDKLLATSGSIVDLFRNVGKGALLGAATTASVAAGTPTLFGASTPTAGNARAVIGRTAATARALGRRLDADSAQSVLDTGSRATNTPFILSGLFDWTNATLTTRVNRVQVAQSASFQTAGSTSDTASAEVSMGQLGTGDPLGGRVYGVIALQRVPSLTTTLRIENYLARKAGV